MLETSQLFQQRYYQLIDFPQSELNNFPSPVATLPFTSFMHRLMKLILSISPVAALPFTFFMHRGDETIYEKLNVMLIVKKLF
jgi:hypothetical protein